MKFQLALKKFVCLFCLMRTHSQIIDDAGGHKSLARQLGLDERRTMFWKRRDSIPSNCWLLLNDKGVATFRELALPVSEPIDAA